MLDTCSETTRDLLALAACVALLSLVASAHALRILFRAVVRLRKRADLERRISARSTESEHARAAVLPPAPR
jgi:hypothetical protein